jgi:hypothetical protein
MDRFPFVELFVLGRSKGRTRMSSGEDWKEKSLLASKKN